MDAAQRQLRTAIRLWFEGGDPVSIHTLAFAAYEIAHVVSKKRNRARRDLIFDTLMIKEEHRAEWGKSIKGHANFFKHAKKDWNSSIEFEPILSELFMMGACAGLGLAGEAEGDEESALALWYFLHRPRWIRPAARQIFENRVHVENLPKLKATPKSRFLKSVKITRG